MRSCKYVIGQCSLMQDDISRLPNCFTWQNPFVSESMLCQHSDPIKMNESVWTRHQTFWLFHHFGIKLHRLAGKVNIAVSFTVHWSHVKTFLATEVFNIPALPYRVLTVPCATFCWVFGAFSLCSHPLLLIKELAECCFTSWCFSDLSLHL